MKKRLDKFVDFSLESFSAGTLQRAGIPAFLSARYKSGQYIPKGKQREKLVKIARSALNAEMKKYGMNKKERFEHIRIKTPKQIIKTSKKYKKLSEDITRWKKKNIKGSEKITVENVRKGMEKSIKTNRDFIDSIRSRKPKFYIKEMEEKQEEIESKKLRKVKKRKK